MYHIGVIPSRRPGVVAGCLPASLDVAGLGIYTPGLASSRSPSKASAATQMSASSTLNKPRDSDSDVRVTYAKSESGSSTRQRMERGMAREADLQKGLKSRHLQMFSIAGMLGVSTNFVQM